MLKLPSVWIELNCLAMGGCGLNELSNWSLKFCDKAWLDEYKDAHDGQPPTFNPKLFEMPKLRAWFGREHRFFVVHFTNGVKAVVNPAHPSDPSKFDFQIGIRE